METDLLGNVILWPSISKGGPGSGRYPAGSGGGKDAGTKTTDRGDNQYTAGGTKMPKIPEGKFVVVNNRAVHIPKGEKVSDVLDNISSRPASEFPKVNNENRADYKAASDSKLQAEADKWHEMRSGKKKFEATFLVGPTKKETFEVEAGSLEEAESKLMEAASKKYPKSKFKDREWEAGEI